MLVGIAWLVVRAMRGKSESESVAVEVRKDKGGGVEVLLPIHVKDQ